MTEDTRTWAKKAAGLANVPDHALDFSQVAKIERLMEWGGPADPAPHGTPAPDTTKDHDDA